MPAREVTRCWRAKRRAVEPELSLPALAAGALRACLDDTPGKRDQAHRKET